jgi:hypothetical protein
MVTGKNLEVGSSELRVWVIWAVTFCFWMSGLQCVVAVQEERFFLDCNTFEDEDTVKQAELLAQ